MVAVTLFPVALMAVIVLCRRQGRDILNLSREAHVLTASYKHNHSKTNKIINLQGDRRTDNALQCFGYDCNVVVKVAV